MREGGCEEHRSARPKALNKKNVAYGIVILGVDGQLKYFSISMVEAFSAHCSLL